MERDYGIPHTTMSNALREYGVEVYEGRYRNKSSTKTTSGYKDLWDTLDDSIKGYVCGVFAADGSLSKVRKRVELSLVDYDGELVRFIASIVADPPVLVTTKIHKPRKIRNKVTGSGKSLVFKATLPKMYDFMVGMGITPAKTYTLDVNLSDKSDVFKWFFLRGVIDGDGWVRHSNTLSKQKIGVTSASKPFLEELQRYFGGVVRVRKGKKFGNEVPLYDLFFTGLYAKIIAGMLPRESFCLKRKTDNLINALSVPCKRYIRCSTSLVGSLVNVEEELINMGLTQPGNT